MPRFPSPPDVEDATSTKIVNWLYRNAATLLLAVVIALSSIVWRRVATSLDAMRGDIRDLTEKVGEVVTNQSVQREMIENNKEGMRDLRKRIEQNEKRWRDQWQENR